eukprot:1155987-Pelagomonas_calceolata.AAC.2
MSHRRPDFGCRIRNIGGCPRFQPACYFWHLHCTHHRVKYLRNLGSVSQRGAPPPPVKPVANTSILISRPPASKADRGVYSAHPNQRVVFLFTGPTSMHPDPKTLSKQGRQSSQVAIVPSFMRCCIEPFKSTFCHHTELVFTYFIPSVCLRWEPPCLLYICLTQPRTSTVYDCERACTYTHYAGAFFTELWAIGGLLTVQRHQRSRSTGT